MRVLVTGSAGPLGEALMRTLRRSNHEPIGTDCIGSAYTQHVGSFTDRPFLQRCMQNVDAVLHTATLREPYPATHSHQDFIDTNVTGSLKLLEEAATARLGAFVFASSTQVFGRARHPPAEAAAVWIEEGVNPQPQDIKGITLLAAENLCELFHYQFGLPAVVLRTAHCLPEEDGGLESASHLAADNVKINELLSQRADLEDVASAHVLALEHAPEIGFARFIVSATTPFTPEDLSGLRIDAPGVVARRVPGYERVFAERGWYIPRCIDRVFDNRRARSQLGWRPRYDFSYALECLSETEHFQSELAASVAGSISRA